MTAAAVSINGPRRLVGLKPANTSEATMFTAGKEFPVVIGIIVANNTGSAADATAKWGDGTTDYDLFSAYSVAAHDVYVPDLPPIPLRENYTIKVTSGTGNALTFTLVIVATGSTLPAMGGGGR